MPHSLLGLSLNAYLHELVLLEEHIILERLKECIALQTKAYGITKLSSELILLNFYASKMV